MMTMNDAWHFGIAHGRLMEKLERLTPVCCQDEIEELQQLVNDLETHWRSMKTREEDKTMT